MASTELIAFENEHKKNKQRLDALHEEVKTDEKLLEFYKYYQLQREVLPTDLIPDEDRKSVIPPKEFAMDASGYRELAENAMSNLYDYIIHLSLKKNLMPFLRRNSDNDSDSLQLVCLGAGCSTKGRC